jgi:hypothetical protein
MLSKDVNLILPYEKQQFDSGKTSHQTITLERKEHAPPPRSGSVRQDSAKGAGQG